MGDENQTNNKGVFPLNGAQTEGTLKPVAVVTPTTTVVPTTVVVAQETPEKSEVIAETANLDHHEAVNEQKTGDGKTYVRLETKNKEEQISGIIELDLISFREKGEENRYLSLETTGVGADGVQLKTSLAIDNEKDFNMFKNFISNLNWND